MASYPPPLRGWSAATAASLGRAPSPFPRPGKRHWPHVPLASAGGAQPLLPPLAELPLPSIAEGRSSRLSPPPSRKWSAATAAFLGRAPSPFRRPGKRQWPHVTLLRAGGARPLLPPLAKLPLPSGSKGRQRLHVLLHRVWTLLPPSAELSRPNSLGQAPSPFRSRGKRSHLPLLGAGGARPPLPPSAELPQPSLAEGGGGGLLTPSAAHSHCRFPRRPGSLSLPLLSKAAVARVPITLRTELGHCCFPPWPRSLSLPSPSEAATSRPHRSHSRCSGSVGRRERVRRRLPRRPRSLSLPSPRETTAASRPHRSRGGAQRILLSGLPRAGREWPPLPPSAAGLPLPSVTEGSGGSVTNPSVQRTVRGRCCLPRRPRSLSHRRGRRQWHHVPLRRARPLPLPSTAELPLPSPREAAVASCPLLSRVATAASVSGRDPSPFRCQ